MSGETTKKSPDADLRGHYDFSSGVRGRYAKSFAEGTNVVRLDPDIAAVFKSSDEVNKILREHLTQQRKSAEKK